MECSALKQIGVKEVFDEVVRAYVTKTQVKLASGKSGCCVLQ